jgi:hypothetical protein
VYRSFEVLLALDRTLYRKSLPGSTPFVVKVSMSSSTIKFDVSEPMDARFIGAALDLGFCIISLTHVGFDGASDQAMCRCPFVALAKI